jgi:putative transposase
VADGPNQVWTDDVTYLPTHVRGMFLYLYLVVVVDVYSRKIVGYEVFKAENAANSSLVVERGVLRERAVPTDRWSCTPTTAVR